MTTRLLAAALAVAVANAPAFAQGGARPVGPVGPAAPAAPVAPAKAEKPADDLKALDGKWVCKTQTFDGEEIPADVAAKHDYTFADGKVTVSGGLAKQGWSYIALARTDTYKVKLGSDKTGGTIDLTEDKEKGRTIPGRYKLEKGKLTVVLNYKDADRPEGFESKEGSGTGVFVFEKEEEKKK